MEENLFIEQSEQQSQTSQTTTAEPNTSGSPSSTCDEIDVTDGWSIVLKAISVIVLIAAIIIGIVLFSDWRTEEYGYYVIGAGIIQFVYNFVIANISKALKKSNAIQEEMLKELKEQNKQKGGN